MISINFHEYTIDILFWKTISKYFWIMAILSNNFESNNQVVFYILYFFLFDSNKWYYFCFFKVKVKSFEEINYNIPFKAISLEKLDTQKGLYNQPFTGNSSINNGRLFNCMEKKINQKITDLIFNCLLKKWIEYIPFIFMRKTS